MIRDKIRALPDYSKIPCIINPDSELLEQAIRIAEARERDLLKKIELLEAERAQMIAEIAALEPFTYEICRPPYCEDAYEVDEVKAILDKWRTK